MYSERLMYTALLMTQSRSASQASLSTGPHTFNYAVTAFHAAEVTKHQLRGTIRERKLSHMEYTRRSGREGEGAKTSCRHR
ncbi:hypothetical protein BDM02DRAFT_3120273 [Thelephora ganbajun]|uniref:Uncharacterized protein n=1 Tax=Thelephora ganbajun TaxID=370292 RepID=A0ACB6Z738_THEGA|nr:hypothetical protein BDM02DRAFT_3120273 [Thelephora ganbajun]